MLLRCRIDDLLLDARPHPRYDTLIAYDGDEGFEMERVEAVYYELVAATPHDLTWLDQAGYRCLRLAPDFTFIPLRRRA
jgi:hypothetical protein